MKFETFSYVAATGIWLGSAALIGTAHGVTDGLAFGGILAIPYAFCVRGLKRTWNG